MRLHNQSLHAIKLCDKVLFELTIGSYAVCPSVFLSVTKLAAMYIVAHQRSGHYRVPYGIMNICSVDLASFKSYGIIWVRAR